jgi:uncharacterized protein YcbX
MSATLVQLYRYPVKGMTAEPLARVTVAPGERLPGDRRFAIAHGGSMSLEPICTWQPRDAFLMLARDERLALLETRYDESSGVLTLCRGGKQVARGNLGEPLGRTLVEQFLAAFMQAELRGAPKLVEALEGGFTDASEPCISIVNLASVRDLAERLVRAPVDPLRFRANLYIDGPAPWSELDWVGQTIAIGPVRLRVTERITRCAATNVDPATAARDLNIPRALQHGAGHCDMGVFAEALNGGDLVPGAALMLQND